MIFCFPFGIVLAKNAYNQQINEKLDQLGQKMKERYTQSPPTEETSQKQKKVGDKTTLGVRSENEVKDKLDTEKKGLSPYKKIRELQQLKFIAQ